MSLALVGHHVKYLILSCVSAPPTLLDVVFFFWSLAMEDLFFQTSGDFQSELHYMYLWLC